MRKNVRKGSRRNESEELEEKIVRPYGGNISGK